MSVTTESNSLKMTKETWSAGATRIHPKLSNVKLPSLKGSNHKTYFYKDQRDKSSDQKIRSRIKNIQKNKVRNKKKRRRKPALQNSPITYIKLPAAPYTFVQNADSSSYYTPKSSATSYFDGNPLQSLFRGVFGEADKSGKLIA